MANTAVIRHVEEHVQKKSSQTFSVILVKSILFQ